MTEKKQSPIVEQLKKELRQAEFIGKFKEREGERNKESLFY